MADLAIELNDAGVQAASTSTVALHSPAYAIVRSPEVVLGIDAYRQAKLFPRDVNHHFWHQLRLEPMDNGLGAIQSHADLAFTHLMQVYDPFRKSTDRVIFGVPPSFSKSQMGLLLGICQRAEIPVAGLVDTAVASVTHPVPGHRMLVVDANNHSVMLTELIVDNGLRRGDVVQLDNFGLIDFNTQWAAFISDSFIRNSRFDPSHSAASEQWLFDSLPGFIGQFNDGEELVELASQDGDYQTTIDRTSFTAAVAGYYQPILSALTRLADMDSITSVLITERLAVLPGFVDLIEAHDELRAVRLGPNAVCSAILKDADSFISAPGKFSLVQQKPWQATPSLVTPATVGKLSGSASLANQATHLLIGSQAYPIGDKPFMFGTSLPERQWGYQISGVVKGVSRQHCVVVRRAGHIIIEDTSTYGSYVNGKRVTAGQLLQVGDHLQLGNPGIEVQVIKQVEYRG